MLFQIITASIEVKTSNNPYSFTASRSWFYLLVLSINIIIVLIVKEPLLFVCLKVLSPVFKLSFLRMLVFYFYATIVIAS